MNFIINSYCDHYVSEKCKATESVAYYHLLLLAVSLYAPSLLLLLFISNNNYDGVSLLNAVNSFMIF